jgi:hypothetical protein
MGRARPFARPDIARVFWGEPAYVTTTGSGRTIRMTALTYHRKTARRRAKTRSA